MRIGVDCHMLPGKFQGSRTFVENLYRDVLRQDKANQYVFFGHWGTSQHFGPRAEHVDYPTRTRWRRLACHARQLAERHGIGLFHSTYISPLALPCDSLLSIHDILFETHPRFFRPAFVARSRFLVRLSALTARLVLTGSQYCRRVIIDRYRLPAETVAVVPPGVDLARFSPHGRRESARVVEKQLGVRDYILTVGRLEPRKNHVGLIKAYAYLHHRHRGLPPLVIVGQPDFRYKQIFETRHKLKLEESVILLSGAADHLLPHLYRAAQVFAYPSFAEGFGIPPLEAMACGTPVVTSNVTAIPEVVGDCGVLVDPTSLEEIARAVMLLMSDSALWRELSIRGRRQAERRSWASAARQFLDVLAGRGLIGYEIESGMQSSRIESEQVVEQTTAPRQ